MYIVSSHPKSHRHDVMARCNTRCANFLGTLGLCNDKGVSSSCSHPSTVCGMSSCEHAPKQMLLVMPANWTTQPRTGLVCAYVYYAERALAAVCLAQRHGANSFVVQTIQKQQAPGHV
jgi:hypothetical protein